VLVDLIQDFWLFGIKPQSKQISKVWGDYKNRDRIKNRFKNSLI
jgi:hypothetical protein